MGRRGDTVTRESTRPRVTVAEAVHPPRPVVTFPVLYALRSLTPQFALCILPVAALIWTLRGGSLLNGSDTTLWFYPFRQYAFASLGQVHLPEWNPHLFAGAPLTGNVQAALFYPPNVLFLFLPIHFAITASLFLHLVLSGFFMRLWMRGIDLSEWGSILAASVYQFSGFQTSRLAAGHVSLTCAMAWIPLLFYLVHQTLIKRESRWAVVAGTAFAVQLLAGHPGISFVTALSVLAYGTFCLFAGHTNQNGKSQKDTDPLVDGNMPASDTKAFGTRARKVWLSSRMTSLIETFDLFTLGVLSVVFFSAIQLLPMWDSLRQSTRSAGTSFEFATSFSLPPENLFTLFVPSFFGNGRDAPYWGRWYGWEVTGYIGILPLVLAIFALMRPTRTAWFLLLFASASLVLSMGRYLPGYRWMYDHIPGVSMFRAPGRMLILWTLAMSALAGMGFDELRRGVVDQVDVGQARMRVIVVGLASIAASSFLIVAIASYQEEGTSIFWKLVTGYFLGIGTPDERLSHFHRFNDSFLMKSFVTARNGCITFLVIASLVLLWLAIRFRLRASSVWRNVWLAAGICLAGADLWTYGSRNIEGEDPRKIGWDHDIVAFLKRDKGHFRVANLASKGGENVGMLHGIEMAGGYDPLIPARFAEYANVSEGRSMDEPTIVASFERVFTGHSQHSRLADLLGVKYVVADKDANLAHEDDAEEDVKHVHRLRLVKESENAKIYENPEAFQRVWIVHDWKVIKEKKNVLHELAHAAIDLRKVALLEGERGIELSKSSSTSKANIIRYSPEHVTVHTSTQKPGLLILADAYASGWKAWVDENETKILRTDYLFRAVAIPAEEHRVVFRYQAPGLRIGATVSAVAWLSLVGSACLMWHRGRRTP